MVDSDVYLSDKECDSTRATLTIINYESATIQLIALSRSTLEEYAGDYDRLVYDKMGFKPSSVYYMLSENVTIEQSDESDYI